MFLGYTGLGANFRIRIVRTFKNMFQNIYIIVVIFFLFLWKLRSARCIQITHIVSVTVFENKSIDLV